MRRSRTSPCAAARKAARRSNRSSWRECAPRAGSIDKTPRPRSSNRPAGDHACDRGEQQPGLLALRYGRTRAQHVVTLLFDLLQHTHAAAAEKIEIDGQAPLYLTGKRQSLVK